MVESPDFLLAPKEDDLPLTACSHISLAVMLFLEAAGGFLAPGMVL